MTWLVDRWRAFVAWCRPLPQIVRVEVPMPPVTVQVSAPAPVPFERGTCSECAYWFRPDKTSGECRAHAPVIADMSALGRPGAIWLRTGKASWCGDFRRV